MILKTIIKNLSPMVILLLLAGNLSAANAATEDYRRVAGEIEQKLNSSVKDYEEGKTKDAKKGISDAYFDLFEASGMESAVSVNISEERKTFLEGMFSELRGKVSANKPLTETIGIRDVLVKELKIDAERLSSSGKATSYSLFLNSLIIILREGFEAILIIGALTAYLLKTGNKGKIKVVYRGVFLAIAASILTAVLLNYAFNISGKMREALEGITMLFAAAVLFYVSWWLISKVEAKRWHDYIKDKVGGSITKESAFTLGFAAFLAVYREGAETALFYQALYSTSGGDAYPLISGFVAGLSLLVVIFILIRFFSVRVPAGPFFLVTSVILYYLAFSFAGKGVREMQEAEWLPSHYINGLAGLDFIGFYPTIEGAALQTVLIALLIFAIFYTMGGSIFRRRINEQAK